MQTPLLERPTDINYDQPLVYDNGERVEWQRQCASAVRLAGQAATEAAMGQRRPTVVETFLAAASILGGADDFRVAAERQAAEAEYLSEEMATHPYSTWEGPKRPNVAAMFMEAVEDSVPGMVTGLAAANYSMPMIHGQVNQFRQDALEVAIASVPTPSPWLN